MDVVKRKLPTCLLLLVFLAGCAPQTKVPTVDSVAAELEAKKQRRMVVRSFFDEGKQLFRIGHRVLTRGVGLCGEKVTRKLGVQLLNTYEFPEDWREAAGEELGLSDLVQVADVAPGSVAEHAGAAAGDVLVRIGDWAVPVGENAATRVSKKLDEVLRAGDAPLVLHLLRGGRKLTVSLRPASACDYDVVLIQRSEKNAFADGKRIVFFTGLMGFLHSDEEVALVLSHELAHNAMGHIRAQKTNAALGGVLGLLLDIAAAAGGVNTQGQFTKLGANVGAIAYSVDFEQEADYVGLYLMARAGYDISGAANLWRRMALENPQSIQIRLTHPTTPERFVALESAIEEVKAKIEAGAPLEPEQKPEAKPVSGAESDATLR